MTTGSGRDPPRRRGARPRLTDEDRSLWERVASTIDPRRRGKPRTPEVEAPPDPDGAAGRATSMPASPRGANVAAGPAPPKAPISRQATAPAKLEPPRKRASPPLPTVDRRQARRIASGSTVIEARLDLHGLTQAAAHGRLISFLQGSAARGLKTVLVITGKGAPRERHPGRGGERDDHGVLRRAVPRWLAEPPLRALVISFQTAAPRHGGEGALYVLIRRGRRPGDG